MHCYAGDVLTEHGHYWVGVDISSHMLDVALDRDSEGDLVLSDMGHGMPFKPGTFDGCIRYLHYRIEHSCREAVSMAI